MKLFQRKPAVPVGFYIGLRDSSGTKSVSLAVFSRIDVDTCQMCTGIYTNQAGETYKEKSVYTEKATLQDVKEALKISGQECALMVDSWGDYYLVYPDKDNQYLGKGYWTTTNQSENTTYINGMYLNIR